MGNPHAVQIVADVDAAPVAQHGPRIEKHVRFAQGVNAGFMQIVSRSRIRLRVWERGAGETLACGTGACAAVAVGIRLGRLDAQVDVETRGGLLTIEWHGGVVAGADDRPCRNRFRRRDRTVDHHARGNADRRARHHRSRHRELPRDQPRLLRAPRRAARLGAAHQPARPARRLAAGAADGNAAREDQGPRAPDHRDDPQRPGQRRSSPTSCIAGRAR